MQYRFQQYLLDTAQHALYDDDQKVDVDPQVLKLLAYLIENRDRVIARHELHEKVFGRRIVTDNALSVRIRDARRAVGDSARSQSVIATVPRVGYRFLASVDASSSGSPDVAYSGSAGAAGADRAEAASAGAQRSGRPMLAVLPFEVIGEAGDDHTIARGLVHDVITRMARSRIMLVIARGTAFRFPSGGQDIREVGTKLGARYVVQGAVQILGNRARVSVGLADTESRREIWSGRYDRTLDDVFTVQDDIAAMIVGALESEIQRVEMQRSVLMPSSRLDAWCAYHRGLDHMYRFKAKECDQAEKYFRRAIDLEPGVPRPYAGLSFVSYERAYLNLGNERVNELRRAFDRALQAISIDPQDPMGHWALSRAHLLDGNLGAARKSIAHATDLNPSYATAQYFQGWVAMQSGDHESSLERIDLARRLSPYDPLVYGMLGVSAMALALMGREEEALPRVEEALSHPSLHYQARAMGVVILGLLGRRDAARALLDQVRAVKPDYNLAAFFAAYSFRKEDDIRRITWAFERADSRRAH